VRDNETAFHRRHRVIKLDLLDNKKIIGEAFHITSDQVLSWDQIYLEAYQALGQNPNVVHIPPELNAAYWPHATGSLIGDKVKSVFFYNGRESLSMIKEGI
jgi:hypothetical protein